MKYIILVPDGMADYPLAQLNGKSPLEAADTPNMDFLAKCGQVGRLRSVPEGMSPASDVANMSILGYNPKVYYTGRGPIEAVNLGLDLEEGDIAFRCNFVSLNNRMLVDYSAGHITTKEASTLIKYLNQKLATEELRFYAGVSYRNLMILKNANPELINIKCFPPHDILGKKFEQYLPRGKGVNYIISLMQESQKLLCGHEVNLVRLDLKENPADMIWLWGQGKRPNLPSFKEKYGLKGNVISAVDLIKGLGKILGLEPINVVGATGYYDTNYKGKAQAAINALKKEDFVFLHVEAPDEAGHNGDLREKILAIERFDYYIVGKIVASFRRRRNFRILVLPDHYTPLSLKTHTSRPVPFVIFGKDIYGEGRLGFNEKEAAKSKLYFESGEQLMRFFLS
ncbi:MAG: cofactor-independent phosphoglycerate mutase [Candidatus Omnitrophica bacterium]|nr:cofactor-independent phosphoglycerate mutase [Candidatus Omnitrophota bacterium]